MKYRIHFESRGAYWAVQFSGVVGLWWRSVCGYSDEPSEETPSGKSFGVLKFKTYDEAVAFVVDKGIDKAYVLQNESFLHSVWRSGVQAETPNLRATPTMPELLDRVNSLSAEIREYVKTQ